MKYLHTMIRVQNLESALDFFITKLGMIEVRRREAPEGRFTLVFLATSPEYTYWRVRTYPIYAAHGWLTGEVEIGTSKEFHSSKESELMSQSRQKDTYIINSMFPTKIWPVPSYIVKSKDLFQLSLHLFQ